MSAVIQSDTERAVQWFTKATKQQLGGFGEKLWSGIFTAAGLGYVRLCDVKSNGAPKLDGGSDLVLPDFMTNAGAKFTIFCDSKAKRHAVFFRLASEWRHGINRRHWEHYSDFSSQMGKHCALAVFEAFCDERNAGWSGALLLQTLHKLGTPIDGIGKDKVKVYWPRSKFILLGEISPSRAAAICERHMEARDFRDDVRRIFEIGSKDEIQLRLF